MSPTNLARAGTLVQARGREWVVLPSSTDELLLVKPLGGLDEEITGLIPNIEDVQSATFPLPTKEDFGDFRSGWLLREAARLSTRASAGPFRSFGRIAAEPRPYQLVPLMMALKLDPVRLLIADDVGIGKTIEACMIARELLDRGEISRFTVLCPPHLAEQWQTELREKFHIDAELILASTIQRLERDLPIGDSVFDHNPFTIVSIDFIKGARRVDDFVNKCPDFVIVDEAHGCTLAGGVGRGRQQRFELLRRISEKPERNVILVTATPHSGNEEAFKSLLSLLDKDFADLPDELDVSRREAARRKLARHLVQRRRDDIKHFLDTDTPFPERQDAEETYLFSKEYRALFEDVLNFLRGFVNSSDGERKQRVRYWSALALMRCLSSSPAAAAATLRSRASVADAADEEVDDVGRRTILDQEDEEGEVTIDLSPGADTEDDVDSSIRRKLLEFARRAEAITPDQDAKLQTLIKEVKALIKDGFHPIVFCRFVHTAEYVAKHLRDVLPSKVSIASVTGSLPPTEREQRITELTANGGEHILVCTDCLSEGINLQEHFDAVIHYDLAWNPTRHEQREGRVDRFGQSKKTVRVLTYYGKDNRMDEAILKVLIRKHKAIKSELGVTVSIPGSAEQIAEALFQSALFAEGPSAEQLTLQFYQEIESEAEKLHSKWDKAKDKEKETRSRYAQLTLSPAAVAAELESVKKAIGSSTEVNRFVDSVFQFAGVPVTPKGKSIKVNISTETPRALRQAVGFDDPFQGRFELPLEDKDVYLGRTSPIVEGLATWTLDQAIDKEAREREAIASRCGIVMTGAVEERTILLTVRFRYHLKHSRSKTILCEEVLPLACRGSSQLAWLSPEEAETLLTVAPDGNIIETVRNQQLEYLFSKLHMIRDLLEEVASDRATLQLEAHQRVRESLGKQGQVEIEPVFPVDILGAYVILPKPR